MSKHKVNFSLQVVPLKNEDPYPAIDRAIAVIQQSGVKYEVQPFSTVMEGELEQLWKLVLAARDAAFEGGADELLLNMQVHLKKDGSVSFEEKTAKFR
jgi:uncharacterized protein YqgV (UPF0045/DUF77 family)